jgi:NAD-dependent SIR2 family protein deacetylase
LGALREKRLKKGDLAHCQQGKESLSADCEAMIKRAVVWYNAGGEEEQLTVVQSAGVETERRDYE